MISCERLEEDGGGERFVYDLTTGNHHYQAGVGQMILHNTDSVMLTFEGAETVQECGDLALQAADFVTERFAALGYPAMVLEFEKIFHPYALFRKKRYVGNKYEPDGDNVMRFKCIDAKGVETERTDALPFLKDIYYSVRAAVLEHSDPQLALRRLDEHMQTPIRNEVLVREAHHGQASLVQGRRQDGLERACPRQRHAPRARRGIRGGGRRARSST